MNTPFVTVITPTHNRAYVLRNAMESILSQTYKNLEYIIVDDNSKDETNDVVKSFSDKRVRYIRHDTNKGPSAARNTALNVAKGDWITYLDDDDELYHTHLEVMLKHIEKNKNTIFAIPRGKKTLELYVDNFLVREIDDSENVPKNITPQDIGLKKFHFDNIGFMHSRKVIDDGIRFDEHPDLGALEDWEFALQLSEKYPQGLLHVPEILYHYHQRYGTDGRVSNDTYKNTVIAFEYVYQKHKHDRILEGQTWYPQRIDKYNKLQSELDLGIAPPKYLLPFVKYSL